MNDACGYELQHSCSKNTPAFPTGERDSSASVPHPRFQEPIAILPAAEASTHHKGFDLVEVGGEIVVEGMVEYLFHLIF